MVGRQTLRRGHSFDVLVEGRVQRHVLAADDRNQLTSMCGETFSRDQLATRSDYQPGVLKLSIPFCTGCLSKPRF